MKVITVAAVAIILSTSMAFAQETGSTTGQQDNSGGSDPGNYLTGPRTQDFYTDESRTAVRPPAEFKQAWDKLNDADREEIKRVCSANRDVSYNPFCTNAKAM